MNMDEGDDFEMLAFQPSTDRNKNEGYNLINPGSLSRMQ